MTISLTPEQEEFIARKLNGGDYASPEMVVSEGLRLLQAKEEQQRRRAELRREIDLALDQAERGELRDAEEVFARILERNRRRQLGHR